MKERPILFSGEMVRAILAGAKTQTRRYIKPAPVYHVDPMTYCGWLFHHRGKTSQWMWPNAKAEIIAECPYGVPGDRLWVRETWMDLLGTGIESSSSHPTRYAYAADTPPGSHGDQARKDFGLKWRASIHMPRVASRITLEITGVRVERLQQITPSDCAYEGIAVPIDMGGADVDRQNELVGNFRNLWESINGPGAWDQNPWVWVVEFKRLAT